MEMKIFLIVLTAIVFLLFFVEKSNTKRKDKDLENTIRKHYGERRVKNFSPYEMEQISYLGKKKKEKTYIDELTWNDLDMDHIYNISCYCKSGIGEEYFYYMLRNPLEDWEKLEELEEKIRCFSENDQTILIQKKLVQLGKIKKYSMMKYLDYLLENQGGKNGRHYLALVLFFLVFSIISFQAFTGLILLFFLLLYQMITYFKDKAKLDPYLQSLRYLFRMMAALKEILPLLPKEWEEERKKAEAVLTVMEKGKKNSFFVLSYGRMAGQGLELIMDYARMIFHFDIIKFNQIADLIKKRKEEIAYLYDMTGKLDACIGIDEFRKTLNVWTNLQCSKNKGIQIEGGYHPLLENPVANDLYTEKPILLTGSNASGKSTFLRMIGVNLLMGQAINTCAAKSFYCPLSRIFTCLSVKDSLRKSESYYMAEIKAIKRMLDYQESSERVICIVDELLRGTNTMERIAAATEILSYMSARNYLVFAATHDLELTKTLDDIYDRYHFEEKIEGEDIKFSFILLSGTANSTNAVNLLSRMGYEKSIVEKARERIKHFQREGEWR